jgi:hypothetical protein
MEGKKKILSAAREIIVEDEKLKLLLKEGKISQETFDYEHKEINARLAEIKEHMTELDRKKDQLRAPASVEKFNRSFLRRQFSRNKESGPVDNDVLSDAGMAAVVFSATIFFGLLVFPDMFYSTLPSLPDPYVLPESSRLYGYLAVLASQTFIGGLFLWFFGRVVKLKDIDYSKAVTCTYSGAIITLGILSFLEVLSSGGKYEGILQFLGYAGGILSYYWAIMSTLRTNMLTKAFLSVIIYAVNYALAIAAAISIIILL